MRGHDAEIYLDAQREGARVIKTIINATGVIVSTSREVERKKK